MEYCGYGNIQAVAELGSTITTVMWCPCFPQLGLQGDALI